MISKISNPDPECVPSNSEIPVICSSAMSAARNDRSRVARVEHMTERLIFLAC
jgi:hypothetical protein